MTVAARKRLGELVGSPDVELVRTSNLFDMEWYVEQYPDVALQNFDPVLHYLWIGADLGRSPSPRFDGPTYLRLNEDVAAAGVNPLVHYLRYGVQEGREAPPLAADRNKAARNSSNRKQVRPTMHWIMNPDNSGWAYGNNARALASQMPQFEHFFDEVGLHTDIALYFDIRVFLQRGVSADRNILRVGGSRPIDIAFGDDTKRLERDIALFDTVIVLNSELLDRFARLHPDVRMVPNALDLHRWSPLPHRSPDQPFTLGFAGNTSTRREARIKGLHFVEEASEFLGLKLLTLRKGDGQIPRHEMRERFFSQIDCLVHPVAPGKEGCSNVIMEALACGVPVITTRDAGFHAERIEDGEGILYARRDFREIAVRIEQLRSDPALAARMRNRAIAFARQHHDISETARSYAEVFSSRLAAKETRKVHFVPFGMPAEKFASSRLRCVHPVSVLENSKTVDPRLETDIARKRLSSASIAVISQLAPDEVAKSVHARDSCWIIYDLCDRYFEDDRIIEGVHAKSRFWELANRADVITASTLGLKRSLVGLGLRKPVVFLPDGVDYGLSQALPPSPADGPLVWFGNPGRGNFNSARWMIDAALDDFGRQVKLISRVRSFRHVALTSDPAYERYVTICTNWAFDSFRDELRGCSIALLSHAENEPTKSPNRLVTSIMNGVPAVASGSESYNKLLREAGLSWAIVDNKATLKAALDRLSDELERKTYLEAAAAVIADDVGDYALRRRYESLVDRHVPQCSRRASRTRIKVLIVTHNLNFGEGAPTSMSQLALGLNDLGGFELAVFSISDGALREHYEEAGIRVHVPKVSVQSRLASKILDRSSAEMGSAFLSALKELDADIVLCNTAVSLWFGALAEDYGIPSVGVIRESSEEHMDFNFGAKPIMDACASGLRRARALVFVSDHTRQAWERRHWLPKSHLIENGILLDPFSNATKNASPSVRQGIGAGDNELLFLSVGSVNPRKSQSDIIDAFLDLPAEMVGQAHLALVGAKPSPYVSALSARLEKLNPELRRRIHLIPETEDVASWYRAAGAFVFASRNESYPRVLIEALYFGLPIVSTDVFGVKEQIVDGVSGLLFPCGDTAALTDRLQMLFDEPTRVQLSSAAIQRFYELPTYWEMVNAYSVILRNVYEDSRHQVG